MGDLIPLTQGARQDFTVTLGDQLVNIRVWWSPLSESWFLDLYTGDRTPILLGTRLVSGRRLLTGHNTNFIGDLFVDGEGNPGRNAWGTTHRLFYFR